MCRHALAIDVGRYAQAALERPCGDLHLIEAHRGRPAALAQTVVGPGSPIPMGGASGAVSGVLGAYLILCPHARILTLLVIGFFVRLVYIPALVVLGFWIVVQFFSGFLTLGLATGGEPGGGVAFWAHVGGFVAGMGLLFVVRPRGDSRRL